MPLTAARFRVAWAVAAIVLGGLTFYFATGDLYDPTIPALTERQAYVAHFTACAVVAFCAVTAIFSRRLLATLAVALLVAACGFGIEVYQYFVPTRTPNMNDVYANTFGAFTGALLAWLAMPLWHAIFRMKRRGPRRGRRAQAAKRPAGRPRGVGRPRMDQEGS